MLLIDYCLIAPFRQTLLTPLLLKYTVWKVWLVPSWVRALHAGQWTSLPRPLIRPLFSQTILQHIFLCSDKTICWQKCCLPPLAASTLLHSPHICFSYITKHLCVRNALYILAPCSFLVLCVVVIVGTVWPAIQAAQNIVCCY